MKPSHHAPAVIDIRDLYAISPQEAVFKAKEDTKKLASSNRIPDQDLLEKEDMAKGYYLDHNELIRRITLLNPKILIQPGGFKGAVAVRWAPDGEDPVYRTGFPLQPLPEYSSVLCDEMGQAKREIRGWRSVLVRLIDCGALDQKKVDVMFGPATGQRSSLWYRNRQAHGKN